MVERDLAAAAPSDTGELSESGQVTVAGTGSGAVATVTFTAGHASFQDDGTGPHDIFGSPWLAFDSGGEKVILRADRTPVHHPGSTKNRGWFTDGVVEAGERAAQPAVDTVGFSG